MRGTKTCSEYGGITDKGEPCKARVLSGMCSKHSKLKLKLHPDRTKNAFLVAFSETGVISYAANAVSINRANHYDWLTDDESYRTAFDAAEEIAADKLEVEARRRAVHGVLRPVFQGGEEVGQIREYSDRLLEMLLIGRRRKVFGNKTEITGKDGGPIETNNLAGLSVAELVAMRDNALKQTVAKE